MKLNTESTLRVLIASAIISIIFIASTSDVFAATVRVNGSIMDVGNGATTINCGGCPSPPLCATTSDGTKLYGCGVTHKKDIVLELPPLNSLNITLGNIYIGSLSKGYIGVPWATTEDGEMLFFTETEGVKEITISEEDWDKLLPILPKYSEEVATEEDEIVIITSSPEEFIKLYPNPSGGRDVYVTITEDYLSTHQVTKIEYSLYRNENLINSFTINENFSEASMIPMDLINNGYYYIACKVTYLEDGINKNVTAVVNISIGE